MHTPKILKIYFTFVMSLVALATMSYIPGTQKSIQAALAFFDVDTEMQQQENFDFTQYLKVSNYHYSSSLENPHEFSVTFSHDAANAYARSAEQGKTVMSLDFDSPDAGMNFKKVRFKIVGMDAEKIEGARLVSEFEVVNEGRIDGEYLEFSYVNFELAAGEAGKLELVVDLADGLKPNDHLRFDIESEGDVKMEVGGVDAQIDGYYPLRGKTLFIVK